MTINIGSRGQAETTVTLANTAKTMGSGGLEVFATPAMVALMEQAAMNAFELSEGQSSVGTSLMITHSAATPIGCKITATAELIEIDRRRLVFRVEASDEAGQIGSGKHERFIIEAEPFLSKAQKRNQRI
ncbi:MULTISPECIES: thioesterase family protein [Desulfosporosinus]|uniref:Fluoroacetyl-CoA thioesterase n=1 Tax=Desulfosporosinus acididurans TaxID=476652 RepID=A0A0J1FY71_9FIRM|nr:MULTISPECIES: thioesterase family protein [Desulfosporosinus]KLU67958.1 fluoroacetyl-CoA thioesterase [Desulfosporosinus acididurans]